jgi:hypothetical protein
VSKNTTCPTCGGPVRVEGNVTNYYVPAGKLAKADALCSAAVAMMNEYEDAPWNVAKTLCKAIADYETTPHD